MKQIYAMAVFFLMASGMNVMAETDVVRIDRNLVGLELRDFKSSTTNTGLAVEFAKGAGVTARATSTSSCYIDGTKITAPNYFTPSKMETYADAKASANWFGAKLTVAAGCTFNIESILIQLGSSTDGYVWDLVLVDSNDSVLYETNKAFKISCCARSNHINDYAILNDTVLEKVGTLGAGTYLAQVYIYGKKNNDILLKTVEFKGNATGGAPYVPPVVTMPDSLTTLVSLAEDSCCGPMYFQHRANLQEAIDIARNDTSYTANYDRLCKAYEIACVSKEEYAAMNVVLEACMQQLCESDATHAGYKEYENVLSVANAAYKNGTVKDVPAQIKALYVASNSFFAAGATAENPVDVTSFIINANFENPIDSTNWAFTYDQANVAYSISSGDLGYEKNFVKGTSAKKFANYKLSQTLVNIPNGDYKFSARVYMVEDSNYGNGSASLTANGKTVACAKSDANGGKINSVYVRVTDNTLSLEFLHKDNRNTTVCFGDVKLEYYNFRSWAEAKEDSLSYTVNINSKESFDDAWKLTGWAEGKDINFILENGTYDLGASVGRAFPMNHGTFTVKAASGAAPVLFGNLRTKGMAVENLIIDGLTFKNESASPYSELAPLYLAKSQKDSVMNEIIIRNCKFYNLPAGIIRLNPGNDTEKYIHSIIVENNYVDGINQNLFQFVGGKSFGLANFTFRENIVKNMAATSGQFFITPLSVKHPANDSIFTMTVEHNTFYKIGGMYTNGSRKFLDCTYDNDWVEVYANFNNNIFYDRYSWGGYAESDVALFNKTEKQTVEVNFLKNVLAPINVMANDGLDKPKNMQSFPVTSGNITVAYDNMAADTVAFWDNADSLFLYTTNAYYTAGVKGTYVGAKATYVDRPTAVGEVMAAQADVYTSNGVLYVRMNEAVNVTVFDMIGRAVKTVETVEGVNAIEGLAAGQIYIVRTGKFVAKVLMK